MDLGVKVNVDVDPPDVRRRGGLLLSLILSDVNVPISNVFISCSVYSCGSL